MTEEFIKTFLKQAKDAGVNCILVALDSNEVHAVRVGLDIVQALGIIEMGKAQMISRAMMSADVDMMTDTRPTEKGFQA